MLNNFMNGFRNYFESIALKGNMKGGIFQRLVAATYIISPAADAEAVQEYAHVLDGMLEYVTLNPGKGYQFLAEYKGLMERLAKVPGMPPEAAQGFADLMQKISRQNTFLSNARKGFEFVPTPNDPYKSSIEMRRAMDAQWAQGKKKAAMRVYAEPPGPEGTEEKRGHPIVPNDQNVVIRGVHDAIAHLPKTLPFDARGEYRAYNTHLKTLCNIEQLKRRECDAAKVLFTEIVGQTSHYYVYGNYAEQKAVILHDFNHHQIGLLAPESPLNRYFTVQGKELVAAPNFNWEEFAANDGHGGKLAAELQRQEGSEAEGIRQNVFQPDKKKYFPLTPMSHTGEKMSYSSLPAGKGFSNYLQKRVKDPSQLAFKLGPHGYPVP